MLDSFLVLWLFVLVCNISKLPKYVLGEINTSRNFSCMVKDFYLIVFFSWGLFFRAGLDSQNKEHKVQRIHIYSLLQHIEPPHYPHPGIIEAFVTVDETTLTHHYHYPQFTLKENGNEYSFSSLREWFSVISCPSLVFSDSESKR